MFRKVLLMALAMSLIAGAAFASGKKVIKIASDCTWPPMEFVNSDKQIVGFSVDLMKAAAKAGDYDVDISNTAWDGIFAGLKAGKYDAICSSVSINEKRKRVMDFTVPYFEVKQAVVTAKDSDAQDLSAFEGKSIGAQIGTTGYFAIKRAEGATAKSYDEIGLAMEDLYNGRLSAVICDDPIAANYALQNKEYAKKLKIAFIVKSDNPEYYGVAVNKGNEDVLNLLNKGLKAIKANGEYDRIKAKWFGK